MENRKQALQISRGLNICFLYSVGIRRSPLAQALLIGSAAAIMQSRSNFFALLPAKSKKIQVSDPIIFCVRIVQQYNYLL